jgi:outer membrane murein-binding lipoprotein Lpp
MMGLLVASVSVGSFMFSGCTQQRKFDVGAQEPASNVQTQAPAPDVQTQELKPDVPYVPTPNEVVAQMFQCSLRPRQW